MTSERMRKRGGLIWGCPKTMGRSMWCYGLCRPHEGMGDCGRPAGHATLGRTQMAILEHKARKSAEEE